MQLVRFGKVNRGSSGNRNVRIEKKIICGMLGALPTFTPMCTWPPAAVDQEDLGDTDPSSLSIKRSVCKAFLRELVLAVVVTQSVVLQHTIK